MSKFLYHPLDARAREIRLITLLPAFLPSAAVKCTLSKASLNDTIRYKALSYVWGDPNITDVVDVNGFDFPVTTNLFSALQVLRQKYTSVSLWIDALCINQDDIPERNHQVNQMRAIYKDAEEVIAWLGKEDNESHLAMHLLGTWGKFRVGSLTEFLSTIDNPFEPRAWKGSHSPIRKTMVEPYVDFPGDLSCLIRHLSLWRERS